MDSQMVLSPLLASVNSWSRTRKLRPAHFVGLALCALLSACGSMQPPQAINPIDTVLADPGLTGATASVMVRDASNGQVLYQHNGDTRLIPASSMKVITAAAALETLGQDYRFVTQLLSDAAVQQGHLSGNLYLRGTGDPSMQAADYQALAAQVAAKGIRVIDGNLILDDTWFDDVRLGSEWANDDESYSYAAQISALTISADSDYNAGSVNLEFTPGAQAGAPVQVSVTPANDYVTIVNQLTTGSSNNFDAQREHGSNRLILSGTIAKPDADTLTVWEPTGLVADVFRKALAEQGVEVRGSIQLGLATPQGAQLLASHSSPPLTDLSKSMLKLSNNTIAEILLKSLGRKTANEGSAAAGITAVSKFLQSKGIAVADLKQMDGSGLSRRNLITTKVFTDLLVAARSQPWFNNWYDSLPVAGNPDRLIGGTLRNRLRGTAAENNAHAKTGSLTGISSLTGYVTSADKKPLAFAIIANNYFGSVKALEDRMVEAMANNPAWLLRLQLPYPLLELSNQLAK
ncbi:D-alanyl-D-alanine carboxypeptidase/D-alanyl-D-alanine-endopeptidase [Neisseriaceae bacterium TC5R-5]|nr:D-alanyl-D-alanine carboxypeptidase/D-alanyl-D-alanine-endopeptidase [Neisseriaceae bacterium TC5R-5]